MNVLALFCGVYLVALGSTFIVFRKRLQTSFDQTELRPRLFAPRRRLLSAAKTGVIFVALGTAMLILYLLLITGVVSLAWLAAVPEN